MKARKFRIISLLALLLLPLGANAQLVGNVISISDGDSFAILVGNQQVGIRLYGVDTPELSQDFGEDAMQFLHELIYNKIVSVQRIDVDDNNFVKGIVMIDDVNLNEALLKHGIAWYNKDDDKNRSWAAMERIARDERKGLWQNPHPLEPWKWRKMDKRNDSESAHN